MRPSRRLRTKLEILESAAKQTGKIPALTEIGYEQIPYPSWWTEVLWASIKDYTFPMHSCGAMLPIARIIITCPIRDNKVKRILSNYTSSRTLFGNDLKKTGEK